MENLEIDTNTQTSRLKTCVIRRVWSTHFLSTTSDHFLLLSDPSGCDVDLTATNVKQYISTDYYPRRYLDNQDCTFTFMAPFGGEILVFFEDVQLEEGFDFVMFRK